MDSASTYCSRKRERTIASRNDLIPRFSVYQLGRGSEPVIVVGRIFPAEAFSMKLGVYQRTCFPTKMKAMRVRGLWQPAAAAVCVLGALFVVAAVDRERTAGPCTVAAQPVMMRDVPEASGLAVSRRRPGLIWTHNDSDNDAELFALDESGMMQGRVRV